MTDDLFDAASEANAEGDVPRDQWGRYLLPKLDDPTKTMAHTRATTFAKSVADTYVLSQWSQRMVAKGLALRPDLFALAAAHPLEDRDELNKVCESAKEAAGAKSRASLGTALHAFTEQIDRGQVPTVPAQWSPEVAAYSRLVADTGLVFAPTHIERVVVIPEFDVAGTFDRIGEVVKPITVKFPRAGGEEVITLNPGDHVVVDLKTGRDLTYGWNEIAIQLALYAHGKAMWRKGTKKYDRMPPNLRQDVALVIHLPVREDPGQEARAELHAVDLAQGWDAAELCHQVRVWRKTRNLAVPVSLATVEGPVANAVDAIEQCVTMSTSANPVAVAIGNALLDAADQAGILDAIGENPGHDPAITLASVTAEAAQQCGAVSVDGIVSQPCTMVGKHLVHSDGRVRWPVVGLADGTGCIQCGARSKAGRIAHKRGCSDVTRGRQGTPIPDPPRAVPDTIPGVTDEKHCPGCGTVIKAAMARCVSCALGDAGRKMTTAIQGMAPAVQQVAAVLSAPAPEPARPAPVVPVAAIPTTVSAPSWADRIGAASSPAELSTIRREALMAGQWTPALQALGMAQLSKIRTA